MNLIQAQQRLIDRVNAIRQPGRRSCGAMYSRSHRAACQELRRYLARIGNTDEALITQIVRDALDMASLERNTED